MHNLDIVKFLDTYQGGTLNCWQEVNYYKSPSTCFLVPTAFNKKLYNFAEKFDYWYR